jgi:hypothetical protein
VIDEEKERNEMEGKEGKGREEEGRKTFKRDFDLNQVHVMLCGGTRNMK